MRNLLVILVFLVAAGAVTPGAVHAAAAKHVLLISIDGLRPDAMMQADTPTLHTLMKRGSYTLVARTVVPSITLTSHVSMMTGVMPLRHHVLWNEWEPERGAIEIPTCFDIVKAAGMTTAMFAGKEKFRHFVKGDRFTEFRIAGYFSNEMQEAAAQYLIEAKPALMMVHLAEPDGAGHAKGWMSPEQFTAIAHADAAVARLLRALEEAKIMDSTAIIVTADHGGHARTHGTMMDVDMHIPWIAAGAGVRAVGELKVPVYTVDTAATVVALLGLVPPADWDGKPVTAVIEGATNARVPGPAGAQPR